MHPRFAVAAAVLLVLAGCAGGVFDSTPADDDSAEPDPELVGTPCTTDDSSSIAPSSSVDASSNVENRAEANDSLSVEPESVFERVEDIRGRSVDDDVSVVVVPEDELTAPAPDRPFDDALGLGYDSPTTTVSGTTNETHMILGRHHVEAHGPDRREVTVAHEYVHVLQIEHGWPSAPDHYSVPDRGSRESQLLGGALMEGEAAYVAEAYSRQHAPNGSEAAYQRRGYEENEGAKKLAFAPYHFGYRYFDACYDSAAELDELYETPPQTTEELLHRLEPGSAPVRSLSVTVDADEWHVTERQMMGELYTRVALATELDEERAAAGADGWGVDRRLEFEDGAGYAWVLRWDDPANATEFADAFEEYLDSRGERTDEGWRDGGTAYDIERVDDETVVVFLGEPSFVTDASSDGTSADVTIST